MVARNPSSGTNAVGNFFDFLDNYLAQPHSKSIKDLAEAAEISRAYLYKLANRDREPTLRVAERLAAAMDADLREILDFELSHS